MRKDETSNGKKGGLLKGKPHYDENGKPLGGIKAIVTDTNTPVELEGGEVIINKHASRKYWKELSKINQSAGNGVPIKNPNGGDDEDPEEYKEGGRIIDFNPNHLPNKRILTYAKKIKSQYPKVWDLGGNIFGNEAFKNLQRVSERGYWLDSEKWMYIKWRSFVARHTHDFRIKGVIAMLKWVDKVDKGWDYMKNLIEAEIEKKYPKENKFGVGGNLGSTYNFKSKVGSSRGLIPNVRGGWTKEKIIKYFKEWSSDTIGTLKLQNYISEFDSWEQFKDHIYYHGTQSFIEKGLKPSITMSDRTIENIGGGGYGQKYFGISLTKRKRTAESFSGMSSGVTLYPVILKRDAKVIERTDLQDASEIEDIIVELYEQGVDAVWIGGGEEELVIVNPRSILLYNKGKEYHSVYGGFKSVALTDEKIKDLYNESLVLSEKYSQEYKSKTNKEERDNYTRSIPSIHFDKGGQVITYRNKFNKKYGFDEDESHSLEEISKIAKIKLSSLQDIYDKGIGAYKTNPESVRPNVKSKEQWAMARVYSAIMGGKASKVDATELSEGKMAKGGLIAPNGRKSNLTPEQYKLVRTPEFKAWFGDWEKLALRKLNDSGIDDVSLINIGQNVSKIVDENGEPKVLYHGTRRRFNEFDITKGGESNTLAKVGFWLTPIYKFAENFSESSWWGKEDTMVYHLFLNIKNPKIYKNDETKTFGDSYEIFKTDVYKVAGMTETDANIGGLGMMMKNPKETIEMYRELLKNQDYDGIIIENTKYDRREAGGSNDQYVALYPNQLKLADGTNRKFDVDNNDIRFAKGGSTATNEFTCEIIKNGERQIDAKSVAKLTKCINSLPQTKELNSIDGKYTDERIKLHNEIIKEAKTGVTCIQKGKPIAVLMGGSPASGKTTFLKKYRPYLLQNNLFKVDADEVRAKLPEYKGWNASQTHKETGDIVKTLISDRSIGVPCLFDFIYDGTMTGVEKYESLIKFLEKEGYEIYIVFMGNVSKEVVKERALKRYQKSGRFVPMEVLDDFFKTGENTLNQLKTKVDGYIVVDASSPNYEIMEQGGKKLPNKRIYEKLGEPIKLAKGGKVKSKNQLGDCYQSAGKMVMDYRGNNNNEIKFIGTPYLVHAEVSGQGDIEGIRYGHAFIVDDVFVYDYSNNRKIVLPKSIYFRIGKIIEKKPIFYKYTFEEAMKKMRDTMNYGPWDLKTTSGL